jgi:hypothetical protein
MKARQLISNASYGPDTLKVLFVAFDEAWDSVAGNFGDDPAVIQAARVMLANIILNLPYSDSGDVERIKNVALQVMALNYRTRAERGAR